jgi:hypothetical protein
MTSRRVARSYWDPLDALWTAAAGRMGFRIARAGDVYASTDGQGTITLGVAETLDPDDCLAQMILHELCHALVQGPEKLTQADWGLDNVSARDEVREHACLRLQAALTTPHGLRKVLAPTTDFRAYYDGLGADPLSPAGEPSVELARRALGRVGEPPFGPHLLRALEATADVVRRVVEAGAGEVADAEGRPCLFGTLDSAR